MVNSSLQINKPMPTSGGLIGSFYAGKTVQEKTSINCSACNEILLPESRFCGECGSVASPNNAPSKQNLSMLNNPNLSSNYLNTQRAKVVGTPAFAQISQRFRKPIAPELKQEYCKISCLLARERVFLLLHYLSFLGGNFFGLWCAFKAYSGLVADEVTRTLIALVPMFCINTVAFSAVVPIGGTKKEIARLKERLTHLHYQIEYDNLS